MKPLVIFDLETTDVEISKARIVEFAALKINPDNSQEKLQFLINPLIPIPNSEIHGITDDMVRDCAPFKDLAKEIADFMHDCDLCGYNALRYDVPVLAEEFARANVAWSATGRKIIDPYLLYKIINPSNLGAVYKKYTGLELDGAHRAMADVEATLEIFNLMMHREEIPLDRNNILIFQNNGAEDNSVDLAGKFIKKNGEICFNFGKHKGEPAKNHKDFLNWMIGKDFTQDTQRIAKQIVGGYDFLI